MAENRLYVLYDGRAMTDTDDASIYCTADTLEEAQDDATTFGECVIYSYRIADDRELVDERFEEYKDGS